MRDEIARARSALHALDPGCDRDTWVNIGMGAKAAGLSVEDFVQWSQPGQNYAGEDDCRKVWQSFKPGGVTANSLFWRAHKAGWQDPATGRVNGHRVHSKASARPATGRTSAQPQHPVVAPLDAWNRFEPATDEHAYIAAKRGCADGLRVVPAGDRLTVAGQPVAGCLVVPALSLAGELRTLQFIPPSGHGEKLNLPGARFADGLFTVGNLTDTPCAYIVEGIGQAWACHRATGNAAVVCFGAGRMAPWHRHCDATTPHCG